MAKTPPKKPKDPARPTRAKAARPDDTPTPDALADLLNPGINKGTAGMGSGNRACSRRRIIRSTAAPIFPPPTRRASRHAKGFERGAAERLHRLADQRARSGVGEGTGPWRRGRHSSPSPAGEGRALKARGVGSPADDDKRTPTRRLRVGDLPPAGGGEDRTENTACRAPTCRQVPAGCRRWASPPPRRRSNDLLREGRPEFAATAVDAAPPAAAGEIRRRPAVRDRLRLRAEGRPAAGDQGTGRRRQAHTTARRCCSASPARARPSPWPR